MSPLVSIIIPCYNAERWVKESITSALNQTYENTEVIFVDNESTDDSYTIAKKVQESAPRLQIYTAPNLYRYSWEEPVNEALRHATGEYFTILGSKYAVLDIVDLVDAKKLVTKNTDKAEFAQEW